MHAEIRKFLYDVKTACETLKDFIAEKSLFDYENDRLLRSAVERQLTIIGEALAQSLKIEPALEENISEIREIVRFRNILVHGYAVIENETVWGILQNDLQPLYEKVTDILQSE